MDRKGLVKKLRVSEGFLTFREFAELAGIAVKSLYSYVEFGVLPAPQHHWRGSDRGYFLASEVDSIKALLAQHKANVVKDQIAAGYRLFLRNEKIRNERMKEKAV